MSSDSCKGAAVTLKLLTGANTSGAATVCGHARAISNFIVLTYVDKKLISRMPKPKKLKS